MARTAIPVLTSAQDSSSAKSLHTGIELNGSGSHGAFDGNGYYLTNPSGRTKLALIIDSPSRAQGTLTVAANPTVNDTFTIGVKVFTIKATAAVNGEVTRGASLAVTQANIVAAINGTDGINTASVVVTAQSFTAANVCVLTAIVQGVAGSTIATTETFTSGSNVFDDVTLGTASAAGQDTAVTVTVLAVADPYGRGGVGATPTYHLVQTIVAGGIGMRILDLGSFTPILYNQSDGTVSVDVQSLTGTGKLVGLNV